MFSATWPKEVRSLANDFQKNAAYLNVGSLELSANHNITQVVDVIDESGKQQRMMGLLNDIMNQVSFFSYFPFHFYSYSLIVKQSFLLKPRGKLTSLHVG